METLLYKLNLEGVYKMLPLLMFLLGSMNFVNAQNCGTGSPTQADLNLLHQNLNTLTQGDISNGMNATQYIPISVNILRRSDESGGISIAEINDAITVVNQKFSPVNMVFELCEDVNFIDNTSLYNFDRAEESQLDSYKVDNTINVFFFNRLTYYGDPVCGYARWPTNNPRDFIAMNNSCTDDGVTFAHELGHYFGLFHTHGLSNSCNSTDELVNGSNCNDAGDFICDTPADPNLSNNSCSSFDKNNCTYTGSYTDGNGQQYNPLTDNIMSYASKSCLTNFTTQQYERILCTALTARNYAVHESSCNNSTNPDLYITSQSVSDTSPGVGEKITVSCYQNVSGATVPYLSPNPYVGYYLSDNKTLESTDKYLVRSPSTIGLSDSNDYESISSIPVTGSWGTGTKYILFVADYINQITESNENNNVKYVQINISDNARLGAIQNENISDFTIFPNPAKDFVNLTFEKMEQVESAIISDYTGKQTAVEYTVDNDEMNLDVSNLQSGSYIVTISYGFGKTKSKKLLIMD